MKPILTSLTSIFLIFICCNVEAQVQPQWNGYVHPKPTVTNPHNISTTGSYTLSFYKGNDTFVINNNMNDIYLGQDSGLSWDKPLVFINHSSGKVKIQGGINAENCQYVKILGYGSDDAYGLEIAGGGVGISLSGLCKGIMYSGCDIHGASQGGVWLKTEVNHACDFYNYWNSQPQPRKGMYGNIYDYLGGGKPMDTIWFIHNRVHDNGGEGLYFGTTDYIQPNGTWRDAIPCLGNQRLQPQQIYNARNDSNEFFNTGRTAYQCNQWTGGTNTIIGNYSHNIGYEYPAIITNPPYNPSDSAAALNQGSGGRVGWESSQQAGRTVEVAYNIVDTSLIYCFDIEESVNFHNNYWNHVRMVKYNGVIYTNPQPLPSGIFYCNNTAVQPQSICNNTGFTGSVVFAVYGGGNYRSTGNKAGGNNVPITVLAQPFNYTTDCSTQDTTCHDSTYTIIHDSLVLGHFDSTFRDSTATVFVPDKITVHALRRIGRFRVVITGDSVTTTYRVLVRPAYDSAYICSLCTPPHDTTVCVRTFPTTAYGVFILQGYNGLVSNPTKIHYAKSTMGLRAMRYNYTVGATYQNQTFLDSNITVTMTYNTADVSVGNPHPFPTNIVQVQKTQDSLFSISKPYTASWLNEPATFAYWDSTGGASANAATYLAGFNSFISTCHAHNVLATDGGLTFSIVYSLADYYTRIGRADSVTWLTSKTGIVNFSNTPAKIYLRDFYNALLAGIRSGAADYVQLHWYEPISVGQDTNTVSGVLPVVIGYLQNQTLKKCVTFETGTGNNSLPLFNAMFTEWKQNQTDFITYFLGSGVQSVPNETYYINFVANNP